MRAEEGGLGQARFDPETVAGIGPEDFLKIFGRDEAAIDQPFPEIGDVAALLQELHHGVGETLPLDVPIDIAERVGHRDQRVGRMMPRRGEAGIGDRRNVEILREILGEHFAFKNVGQQFLIARPEDDVVVAQIGVAVAHLIAEIDHHQRHALLAELDQRVAIDLAMRLVDQLEIGVRVIAVRHHDIGLQRLARGECHAGGDTLATALLDVDPIDLGVELQRAAQFLELADHCSDERTGAAHREMHAPGLFDEMDHRIDGGHLQRVAADEQRFEAEHLPHLVALEIFADERKQRLHRAQLEQIGHDAEHRPEAAEIGIAEFEEAALEDRAGGLVEAFVAFKILGRELGDLGTHIHRIGVVIEEGAVIEIDAVEGQDRDDLKIAAGVGAAADARQDALFGKYVGRKIGFAEHRGVAFEREQLLDEVRHGQHGRPHVEGEALRAADIGAAARRIELFDDARVEPQALQPDRAGDAADPGADHDGSLASHNGPGPDGARVRRDAGCSAALATEG